MPCDRAKKSPFRAVCRQLSELPADRVIAPCRASGKTPRRYQNKTIITALSIGRMLVTVVLSLPLFLTGCSQNTHIAPVRPYSRDLSHGARYYQVKPGDTLYSIGFRSGHGYQRLAVWNNIPPPYTLRVGQKIRLFPYKQELGKTPGARGQHRQKLKVRDGSQKKPIHSTISKMLLKFNWQWPIKGTIAKSFAQSGNKGIDIYGKMGQPVKAAAPGRVVYSGHGLIGYGNLLIIKHNAVFLSAYANNRRLLVKEGQPVKKGQIIAEVGKNGSTRPSLHFEIRKNGKPVNPLWYLPRH